MIDLSPAQAADRITALLAVHESRSLDFKAWPHGGNPLRLCQ